MSAISLKSITGITSITTPAGVDNQLTLHNNNTTEAVKLDIAGNLHFHNHLNITGVSTASNFKTGTSNLHNTGLNVFGLDVDGHTNLDNVNIAGVTTFTGGVYSNSSINLGGELNFTGNGHKYIDVATLNGSNTLTIRHQDGGSYETAAYFDANGGAYLQFNGNTKFATTNTGAVVTGNLDVNGSSGITISGSGADLTMNSA